MADEPTLGEALRLLDSVSRRLERLAEDMDKDRREAGRTYVPRELFNEKHGAHERRIGNLEEENEERDKTAAETRRQFMFLILGAIVTALCALIVAVYLGSGGAT